MARPPRARTCCRRSDRLNRIRRLLALALRLGLAAVLGAAAVLKLARPRTSQEALATFGLSRPRVRSAAWGLVVAVELALAGGVALGSEAAAYAAAALLAGFALAVLAAIRAGKGGAPCACFGARSRVGPLAVGRNLALAAAFAALPSLSGLTLPAEGWLAVGLAVSLAGVLVLGVAVLGLAREIASLRVQLPPQGALEIASERPLLGERTSLAERFAISSETRFLLAVFTSPGCKVCRALEPSLATLARDPLVALERFDEERDPQVWRELAIPGSPYAVALDLDGVVRAKGTFNTVAQLETVLGAAERRTAVGI